MHRSFSEWKTVGATTAPRHQTVAIAPAPINFRGSCSVFEDFEAEAEFLFLTIFVCEVSADLASVVHAEDELCSIVSRGWPVPSPLEEFDDRVHDGRLDLDWRWHRVIPCWW